MDSFSQARQRKQVLTVSSNASSNTSSDNDGSLSDLASSSSSLSVSPSSASASSKNPLLTGSTSTDSSARRGKEKRNGSILLPFDEIPEWQQDNEYIRHGYRPESGSMRACFASWLYLHNETINIFSHLVPAIFFLGAEVWIFSFFKAGYPQAKPLERFVFAFFLLSAFVCLGLSACYHTMLSHSAKVSELWLRLDFIGIVCLTLGDFVSGIYMMFYCEPTLQKVYWTMILTPGTVSILILVNPKFQVKKYWALRVSTFVCTGLSGFVPLAHGCVRFGFSQMMKQSGMPYYLVEGVFLLLGAVFYTTRMPEVLKPGRFDFFGCSHQIFHVLVVSATFIQLLGIVDAYDYNYHHRACGPAYSVAAPAGK